MAERLVDRPQQVERLRLARDLAVSPRRFHGWEPKQVQRGYDQEGQQVALADAFEIVTEVEPEWSDDDRAQMLALGRYESKIHRCGLHESQTDPDKYAYTFEVTTCPVCAAIDQFHRTQAAQDAEFEKHIDRNAPPSEPRPKDGRSLRVRRMSEAEVARRKAKPSQQR